MKLLHTADWHLGRYLHGHSLLEDQAHILAQFVSLAHEEKVNAILIAGDVYDRSVPPAEAVALLDKVLAQLVIEHQIPVILIAGNHDSPERVAFGSKVFQAQGLHLRGTLADLTPVVLSDQHGEVAIFPLPYVEPIHARGLDGGEEVHDHQSALAHVTTQLRQQIQPGQRSILVGHAFVAGGTESDSERPLSVGGSGIVSSDTLSGFNYVALGHLHRPQRIADNIHYSGSLLKYSFNEVSQPKSVSLVELGADGVASIEYRTLSPQRDVRIIKGKLLNLINHPDPSLSRDDYLCAHLTDEDPVLDPMSRLREVYPNMMELQFTRDTVAAPESRSAGDHRKRQPADIFKAFFRDMEGEEMTEGQVKFLNETLQYLNNDNVRAV